MPVIVDGFQEDSTFELFFSNGGPSGDLMPICTLVAALAIFRLWIWLTD
jgi:hypothetical protein